MAVGRDRFSPLASTTPPGHGSSDPGSWLSRAASVWCRESSYGLCTYGRRVWWGFLLTRAVALSSRQRDRRCSAGRVLRERPRRCAQYSRALGAADACYDLLSALNIQFGERCPCVLVTVRPGSVPAIVVNTRAHVAPRRSPHTRGDRAPLPSSGYFCVLSSHSCRLSHDRLAITFLVRSPCTGVD